MAPKPTYPVLHIPRVDFAIPALGFGTFEPTYTGSIKAATAEALKAGYRHIDTAALYGCEKDVGEAIRESGIPREEIFLTTKFWNQWHEPEAVERSLEESLERMGLDYVDLYLMHWPIAFKHDDNMNILYNEDGTPQIDEELSKNHITTYEAMENLVRRGKALHIGVSNFSEKRLAALLPCVEIPPVVNQVEAHPYFPQKKLLQFCKDHHIMLQAYTPLGKGYEREGSIFDDETISTVARKNNATPAQVLIAWAIQRGTTPLPKSSTKERILGNAEYLHLSDEDFEAVDTITERNPEKERRMVDFDEKWGVKKVGISSIWDY